jgi:hypothetical protein
MVTAEKHHELWEIKGKESWLFMHPGQLRAWDSTKRWILVLAGSQSGKTSWGPLWLHREITVKGPGDYLGVTATFPLLKLKMLPELQKCFETYLRIATYIASDHIFKSNEKIHGAEAWRIILGSASNAESLESATAKAAWCDEAGQKAFSLSAWEAVRRRLALNRGRALMTTTPYGLGWLKSEFYDKAMEGDKEIDLIQFDSTLNPAFPKEEFEQRRAEMPQWKFNMFYRGMFERPVGLIYDAFDEKVCKIKRFPIPEQWPCYVGHDFGGANPAALFYRVDPTTGYIYAWHEYRPREGKSIFQHVEEFKRITAGVQVFKRAGGSHQEDEIRQGYTAHGWPISEPKFHGSASVEAGISAVYALHKRNKLFIFDDLVNYLDEKSTYSRKLDANFLPTDEIDNKSDYHLLDCLVAGTMITTDEGQTPIENIRVGDKVLTRKGYRPVTDLFQQEKATVTVQFNGGSLTGTHNHHVYVKGRGFVPLDDLRCTDTMETWKENVLFSGVLSITGIPWQNGGRIESTSNTKGRICIGRYGRMLTALFPKGASSTMRTTTRSTTPLVICSAKQLAHICQSIKSGGCTIWSIWQQFVHSQKNGMGLMLAGNGTGNIQNKYGPTGCQSLKRVNNAESHIQLSSRGTASFVQYPANRRTDIRWEKIGCNASVPYVDACSSIGSTLEQRRVRGSAGPSPVVIGLLSRARCAARHLLRRKSQTTRHAPETAVAFLRRVPAGRAKVYDITVADAHEYYANGILVHNSERSILSDFTPDTVTGNRARSKRSSFAF